MTKSTTDGTHKVIQDFTTTIKCQSRRSDHDVTIHDNGVITYAFFTYKGSGTSILNYSSEEYRKLFIKYPPLLDVKIFVHKSQNGSIEVVEPSRYENFFTGGIKITHKELRKQLGLRHKLYNIKMFIETGLTNQELTICSFIVESKYSFKDESGLILMDQISKKIDKKNIGQTFIWYDKVYHYDTIKAEIKRLRTNYLEGIN